MSKYQELRRLNTKHTIVKDPKKVFIKMVSCMCDNSSEIIFTKKDSGEYSMCTRLPSGMGYSFSNYQTGISSSEVAFDAMEGNWNEVLKVINSGTAVIEQVRSI